MRICHIIEATGGGSGQVALDLLATRTDGDSLTLIYSPTRAEPAFLEALKKIEGHVALYPFPMQRSVGPHDIPAAWRLFQLFQKVGPFDIIHSHSSKAGALARIAGFFLPGKQIYTPHAFMTLAPGASPVYGWIEWILSWLGRGIVCVSEDERTHARKDLHIAASKLFVIPNGVKLDYPATRSEARAKIGARDDEFVIGFVGRLVEQKNPLRLIEAMSIALKKKSGLRLVIIGDGPLHADVENAMRQYGIERNIQLLGRQNGRDYMPGFDCLACSADYEGFSVVFLEALAASTPIVTTPVGGARDIIGDNTCGLITPDMKAESLAAALLQLAETPPDARAELREAAQARANDFTLELLQKRTRELYAQLSGKA